MLVAEDASANRELVQVILENHGYAVTLTSNGLDTVERLTHEPFDVVLMDVKMPVLNGLDATRQIRALPHRSNIPIIATTAHAMPGDREECLAAGMDEYLAKPIDARELISLVERLTGRSAAGQPAGVLSISQPAESTMTNRSTTLIDREGALARMGGDASLLREMARFFMEDAPPLLQTVKTERTGENATRAAHSLKGLASNFGAATVTELARKLETVDVSPEARDQAINDLEQQLGLLLQELRSVAEEPA